MRIMSGDDPRTVAAIGRTLELENCDKIVDCARLNDEELRASARDGVIFGRLTPDRKRILVDAFKEAGHHVAMTGDGVNDIPSLKAADCSIAMGGGAEATEHAAQLVLLNNDFNSLPEVVREGRREIGNITRTSSLFLRAQCPESADWSVSAAAISVPAHSFNPGEFVDGGNPGVLSGT